MKHARRSGQIGHRASSTKDTIDPLVDDLRRRFATFRRSSKQPTRIPDPLRQAAIDAFERGVTPATLRESCGVTATQLLEWKLEWKQSESKIKPVTVGTGGHKKARCFSVVQPTDTNKDAGNATTSNQAIELQVGAWKITIRPTHRQVDDKE